MLKGTYDSQCFLCFLCIIVTELLKFIHILMYISMQASVYMCMYCIVFFLYV